MNRLWLFLGLLLPGLAEAQYQYEHINHINNLRYSDIYRTDVDFHSDIRPFNKRQLDTLIEKKGSEDLSLGYSNIFWRKLFDEDLVHLKGPDYEFTINPVFNFRIGSDLADDERLYTSTRGLEIQATIGDKFSFQTSFLENQARLPNYVANFERAQDVIPGQGYARPFGGNSYDFGMASGVISYTPNKTFSFSLGQGRHFIGEGHRSLLLSDAAFNYPFFRIETNIWKVKYMNLWAQMYDVRPEVSNGDIYARKFFSSHYFSINVTPRLNLGFFESIVIGDTLQQQGVDISFFNPVILYRPIEFAVGSGRGNALIGLTGSYKIADGLQAYGQFVLDEFEFDSFTSANGSWENKFGWQLGLKSYDALGVDRLFLRFEYNAVRPYTYSHFSVLTNYGHYGQPIAHPWGANFHELIFHSVYQYRRWEFEARYHFGVTGLDTNGSNWGGNIYSSYDEREQDLDNVVAQGAQGRLHYLLLRSSWLMNPASNMKLELGVQIRNMVSDYSTSLFSSESSTYIFAGVRTEFFNNYYDF